MEKMHIKLNVNGKDVDILTEPRTLLIHALREELGITGPHIGCSSSHCGACTVDMNGMSVKSCTVFAAQANGAEITTIEGLSAAGELHPLQKAWVEQGVPQCGYCQSGQIMTAAHLLANNPSPDREQIVTAMTGNLCRCGTYPRIVAAVESVAGGVGQYQPAGEDA